MLLVERSDAYWERVDELLVIARLLANDRDRRAGANGRAVWDTWVSRVVPYAVSRDDA